MNYYTQGNYYDLLEIGPRANQYEIEEAYQRQLSLLNGESLATYGLFVGQNQAEIIGRVEDAYQVLSDPKKRRRYDLAELGRSFVSPKASKSTKTSDKTNGRSVNAPLDDAQNDMDLRVGDAVNTVNVGDFVEESEEETAESVPSNTPAPTSGTGWQSRGEDDSPAMEPKAATPPEEVLDGAAMRAIREEKDITLEAVSATTKISQFYLAAIEADRYSAMPPAIYLKGYVKQYAEAIGVNAEKAMRQFFSRYNAAMNSD